MSREPNMVDLPCEVCEKVVTVTVKKAVERGVPMEVIRKGQDFVTDWVFNTTRPVKRPRCREHYGVE